jgi:hypothetical protein
LHSDRDPGQKALRQEADEWGYGWADERPGSISYERFTVRERQQETTAV